MDFLSYLNKLHYKLNYYYYSNTRVGVPVGMHVFHINIIDYTLTAVDKSVVETTSPSAKLLLMKFLSFFA